MNKGEATAAERQRRYRGKTDVLRSSVQRFKEAFSGALDRANCKSVSRFVDGLPDEPTAFLDGLSEHLETVTLIPYRNRPEGAESRQKGKRLSWPVWVLYVLRIGQIDPKEITGAELKIGYKLLPQHPGLFADAWLKSDTKQELVELATQFAEQAKVEGPLRYGDAKECPSFSGGGLHEPIVF